MATQDVTLTLQWTTAAIGAVTIVPQADGSIVLEAFGLCNSSDGQKHQLAKATLKVTPGQVPAIDNILAAALVQLRKANGLEV